MSENYISGHSPIFKTLETQIAIDNAILSIINHHWN